jgi:hypothetical protein
MPDPVVIYADDFPDPGRPPALHIQMQARQATVNGRSGWCPADGAELEHDKAARMLSCPRCDAHWRVPVAVFMPLEGFYGWRTSVPVPGGEPPRELYSDGGIPDA